LEIAHGIYDLVFVFDLCAVSLYGIRDGTGWVPVGSRRNDKKLKKRLVFRSVVVPLRGGLPVILKKP